MVHEFTHITGGKSGHVTCEARYLRTAGRKPFEIINVGYIVLVVMKVGFNTFIVLVAIKVGNIFKYVRCYICSVVVINLYGIFDIKTIVQKSYKLLGGLFGSGGSGELCPQAEGKRISARDNISIISLFNCLDMYFPPFIYL